MSTSWAEIISDYAKPLITDMRLDELLATNPAQFFRKMQFYLQLGIPLFNRPPEVRRFLEYGLVMPQFTDFEWVSTEGSMAQDTTVDTGKIGYELFSCSLVQVDGAGNVLYVPYPDTEYDETTGEAVFPVQSAAGLAYTMDFYTDGSFENDLTLTQKRILGLCVAQVWYEPVANNWLNMQPKLSDPNFNTKSESQHIQAMTARMQTVRANLTSELRKYEQDCAYGQIISPNNFNHLV